jgi:hypothetical protein
MRTCTVLVSVFLVAGCTAEVLDDELGDEADGPIEPDPEPDDPDEPEAKLAAQMNCTFVPKVIVYSPGFNSLLPEIAAQQDAVGATCAQYYFMLPAVQEPATCVDTDGDGTDDCLKIRARTAAAVPLRARSPHGNFHAMAEFHWHHWAAWIARSPGTRSWAGAGRAFRRDMADAGFDVAAGDLWSINELHSGLRRDEPGARANFIAAVTALHAGDPDYVSPATGLRAGARRGVVFAIGLNQTSTNLSVYKENVRNWLRDAAFWNAMKAHVLYFAQEVYPSPATVCAPGTRAQRAASVNAFAEHFARIAFAADGTSADAATAAARSYFDKAYVPLLGGVWPSPIYGDTEDLSAAQMMHFISTQVYATRLWAANHPYPDARIGIAWRMDSTPEANKQVSARAASSILNAYSDRGSSAARACSPDGADTWCKCSVSGATFNPSWSQAFSSW